MKFNGKICIEKDGIKVGDKVKYRHGYKKFTGYVAVIDPNYDESFPYLLRLKGFLGNGEYEYWNKDWYPENEKKGKENCWWTCKNKFEVIGSEELTANELLEHIKKHGLRSEEHTSELQSR